MLLTAEKEDLEMTHPVKVLYVISTLNPGGAERQLLSTISHIDKTKITPLVCSLSQKTALLQDFEKLNIPVYLLRRRGWLDFTLVIQLARVIRRTQPDLVHSQMFLSNLVARFALLLSGRPVLLNHEHGLGTWKTSPLLTLDRLTHPLVSCTVTASECSRKLRIRRERLNPNKLITIYNGIDLKRFTTRSTLYNDTKRDRPPTIGVVTRLMPVKNLPLLIRSMVRVRSVLPYARLIIVGDGPERKALESLVFDLVLQDTVTFTGYRPDVEVCMRDFSIFCLCSLREDMPVSLLEAMAMGLPVVATRVGGIPEIVEEGKTGFLISLGNGDENALADALLKLLLDPDRAIQMGQAGRLAVEKRFSATRNAQEIMLLYDTVLSSRKRAEGESKE